MTPPAATWDERVACSVLRRRGHSLRAIAELVFGDPRLKDRVRRIVAKPATREQLIADADRELWKQLAEDTDADRELWKQLAEFGSDEALAEEYRRLGLLEEDA